MFGGMPNWMARSVFFNVNKAPASREALSRQGNCAALMERRSRSKAKTRGRMTPTSLLKLCILYVRWNRLSVGFELMAMNVEAVGLDTSSND